MNDIKHCESFCWLLFAGNSQAYLLTPFCLSQFSFTFQPVFPDVLFSVQTQYSESELSLEVFLDYQCCSVLHLSCWFCYFFGDLGCAMCPFSAAFVLTWRNYCYLSPNHLFAEIICLSHIQCLRTFRTYHLVPVRMNQVILKNEFQVCFDGTVLRKNHMNISCWC